MQPALSTNHHTGRPPGPRGLAALAAVRDFLRDPLGFMLDAHRRYGGLVRLPGASMYLVHDPALVEHVFVTDARSYHKDAFMKRVGREALGQGLLASDGELWRTQRRLAQPAFHRERIASYADLMAACAAEYAGGLRAGETRDLQEDLLKLTLRTVLRALLSDDSVEAAAGIAGAFSELGERHAQGGVVALFPFVGRLPLPSNRRFARAMRRLDEIVREMVRRRRAEPAGAGRTDLLAMYLAAQDEDGAGMSDTQLRDEIVTMFAGGYETTALALSYGFMLLSRNPAAERALGEELSSVLAGRAPGLSDLPSLRYTEAVLLESMRLYPPAWALGREAIRDTELGGYPIPRGATLYTSPWVVHRDPAVFEDPESFRPERWLDGLSKRIPRFAYMPFGGGPRLCIGNAFAMTEAKLILATVASRFRMRVSLDPGRLRFRLALGMQSRDGMPARVEAAS